MRFGLTTWQGDGTEDNGFRPAGVDGDWTVIDLRPDPTVVDGFCLYAVEGTAVGTLRDLGEESLDDNLSTRHRQQLGNDLGVDLADLTLRGVVAELLILHGTAPTDRTRWNRLQQTGRRHEIWMGNRLVFQAPVIEGVVVTESFDKADSTTLGPDQTWTEFAGDLGVVNQRCQCENTSQLSRARCEADLAGHDNYAQYEVIADSSNQSRTLARYQSGADTTYFYNLIATNEHFIGKYVTGSFTNLTGTTSFTRPATPYTQRTEAEGSTIRGITDGTTNLQTTDTSITTGTRGGIALFAVSSAGGMVVDNFEMGDLAAPATVDTAAAQLALRAGVTSLALGSFDCSFDGSFDRDPACAGVTTTGAHIHVRSGTTTVVVAETTVDTAAANVHVRPGETSVVSTGSTVDTAAARLQVRAAVTSVLTAATTVDTSAVILRLTPGETSVVGGETFVTTTGARLRLRAGTVSVDQQALVHTLAARLRTTAGTTTVQQGQPVVLGDLTCTTIAPTAVCSIVAPTATCRTLP